MLHAALLCIFLRAQASGPMAYGQEQLADVLGKANLQSWSTKIATTIKKDLPKEGYVIRSDGKTVSIMAGDQNGALYGQLELAERVQLSGAKAFSRGEINGKPFLEDRGWNMFLPLPWDYDKNFVDNDPAALIDPNRWFFQNEDYWKTLFKQMAWSRLNWLDIHGPYDLDTTRFPNLYAYFIQSDKFPLVGVDPEIKKKNLDRFNWIIREAHRHGIRVSLMSYEARFDTPHNLKPPYKGDEAEVYEYTKEVVEKMIRQAPGSTRSDFGSARAAAVQSFSNVTKRRCTRRDATFLFTQEVGSREKLASSHLRESPPISPSRLNTTANSGERRTSWRADGRRIGTATGTRII